MTLRNCVRCGAVMLDMNKICRKCREAEEEEYRLVSEYLRKQPGSSITQIHEATGVKETVIMSFIRRGRLEAEGVAVTCSSCGKEYAGSKTLLCPACTARMERDMDRAAGERKKTDGPPPKRPPSPGGRDDGAFSSVRRTKL